MAKARASDAAWRVTADALQVLGGIGFTWEHDLQFLLKRAKVGAELLGDPRAHNERVASLVGCNNSADILPRRPARRARRQPDPAGTSAPTATSSLGRTFRSGRRRRGELGLPPRLYSTSTVSCLR